MRALAAVAVGAAVLLGAGCTIERRPEAQALPSPLTKPIPLRMGVHYTLEFRLARPTAGARLWNIGDASVTLFDSVLRKLFEEVVTIDPWPAPGKAPAVTAVIVPSVVDAWASQGEANVRYRVEVFSLTGQRAAGWEIAGRWERGPSIYAESEAIDMRHAMRSAGAALVNSFFTDPEARAWLARHGITAESLQ